MISFTDHRPQIRAKALIVPWVASYVLFTLFYLVTAQKGLCWQDSGTRQWRILNAQYTDKLGLALAHPLFIAAGRAISRVPVGDVLWRLNALSGLAMAVALANLAAVVAVLTGKRWTGLAAAAMLGVCHTAWWLATITEVYCLQLAALSGEILLLSLLIRGPTWYFLTALAFVSGLDLSIHDLALLPLPVYVVVMVLLIKRRRLPVWSLAAATAAFLLGASPYLWLIGKQAVSTGNLGGAVYSALFGDYAEAVLNISSIALKSLKANAAIAAMNFASSLLPLAIVGWMRLRRFLGPMTARSLWAITAIEIIFVVRYPIPDQFTFYLPSLWMIALAAGIGLAVLVERSKGWSRIAVAAAMLSIVLPPAVYALTPSLMRRMGVAIRHRELPFRNEARYWLVPWKQNEYSADLFATAALSEVPRDAVILADGTTYYPLLLTRELTGWRRDVELMNLQIFDPAYDRKRFEQLLAGRLLFVVTPMRGYLPDSLLNDADFLRPEGKILYQVQWK
jgi:hypothetical protein